MESNGIPLKEKQKQMLSPREFIMRYVKYLPWIVISVAVALIIAKMKLRYEIPIYKTEARLLIKKESPYGRSNDKFDDIFMQGSNQNVYNEIEIIKSRPLAAKVARALHLQTTCYNKGNIRSTLLYPDMPVTILPVSAPDSTGSISIELTITDNDHFRINDNAKLYVFGETINSGSGQFKVIRLAPRVYNATASNIYILSHTSLSDAANRVVGGLNAVLGDNFSQIINLSYESENTQLSADILNTLMGAYKESNIEDKRQMRISTLEFIDERLDSLRIELGIVEKGLTEYIEANKAFMLDKQSELYLDKLSMETTNLAQQDMRIAVMDWLIRYLNNNTFKAVPVELGTQEPTLVPLITQYNQLQLERQNALATMPVTNPYIQNNLDPRIGKLRTDIQEAIQNVRQASSIVRSSMQGQTNHTEGKLQSIPSKGREMQERARQQKIKEELYLFLLQKKEETAIASASTISDSKTVEPARATGVLVRPNRRSIYMLGIFLGLAIPIGIILLREYLNDKVRDRSDIQKATDAPFIGEIGHSEEANVLVVKQNSRRFISEQFRIIRTNLQFILNKVQNPVLLVTSSFSGEGKSFISTNAGAVMALTGKRTVIIELDIRKPKVVSNLELKKQAGLTNFIVGRVNIHDIILPVPEVPNLFVIPCGPVPPNPAELLLDSKMKELFDYVRKHFDIILVDTAPVGLVSDAIILGEYADCTLYILRQNYTYKKQLDLIDELYRHKKLPNLSLLLNDVETGSGYGGYYGRHYGYGYGYGYGSGYFDEETKKKKKNIFRRITSAFKF